MVKYIVFLIIPNILFANPQWVETLKNGDTQMKIEIQNKYYFRNIYVDANLPQAELCKAALDANISFLHHNYPFSKTIPFEVQVVYYDKINGLCATTIVLDKSIADTMNDMNKLYTQNKALLDKNKDLETTIMQMDINKVDYDDVSKKLAEIRAKKIRESYNFEQAIKVGMSEEDLEYLLEKKVLLKDMELCYNNYSSRAGMDFNDYVVCFDRYPVPNRVVGVCNKLHCWENPL